MPQKTSIALGFFDGVHLAHRKIIEAARAHAEKSGLAPMALTFDRSPAEVLFGSPRVYLTDNREKERLITELGAECVMLETTPELLKMCGEAFVEEILIKRFSAGALFCGYNYTFGSDLLTAKTLEELGRRHGLYVEILPEECSDGLPVSSSRIRALLEAGKTEEAAGLLGRPYSVTETVQRGKGLGHTKGFPTLNIYSEAAALLPRGVYATRVSFGDERHIGVTNIGVNPTVGGESFRVETYLPDFNGNLYGREVRVEFFHFVRPERKFDDLNELYAQITADTETIKQLMKKQTS